MTSRVSLGSVGGTRHETIDWFHFDTDKSGFPRNKKLDLVWDEVVFYPYEKEPWESGANEVITFLSQDHTKGDALMARGEIHNEVLAIPNAKGGVLCFQKCTYHYDEDPAEEGYRFIWRRPNGDLQAARGQARIPDAQTLNGLLNAARQAGWFV